MKALVHGFVLPFLLASLLFVGLLYFVFPTTTFLDQRAAAAETTETLAELQAERAELRAAIDRLENDDEIERIARRDFSLVYPGEEAFALLPAAPAPLALPTSWPFTVIHEDQR